MIYLSNPNLRTIKDDYLGNPMIRDRFLNYKKVTAPQLKDILKWKFAKNPQAKEKSTDLFTLATHEQRNIFERKINKIVWLGHASFLITLNGKNILLDPVFDNIPLIKRRAKIPFTINDYQAIDYILISHAHYDHLDKKTVVRLCQLNHGLKIYCGLHTTALLHKWKIKNEIIEAGWYQEFPIASDGLKFYFMPALHWSNRSLTDRNTRLWGSFVILGKDKGIYFMGDSGYAEHFKEIGKLFAHQIDYAILGVGAYMPRNIMQYSHINPAEARQAYVDLRAKYLLPMHYATYNLTDEPYGEPILKTRQLFASHPDWLCETEIGKIIPL